MVPQRGRGIFISGLPGKRGWHANLRANPQFIFHLKGSVKADLPAKARPITDIPERQAIMSRIVTRPGELDRWVKASPLVEVELERP